MELTQTYAYKKAFQNYLRYGISIDLQLKAATEAASYYIWRTQEDEKVRASHAANNGRVFAWNDPPSTGHPGEAYNCRCYAEPVKLQDPTQRLLTRVVDAVPRWEIWDFVQHAYFGNSADVTLSQIGHLGSIIRHAEYGTPLYKNLNEQIVEEALSKGEGSLIYPTSNSYDFRAVSYPHGSSIVNTLFTGSAKKLEDTGLLYITGIITYNFDDIFTDPTDIREVLLRTSDPDAVPEWVRRTTDLLAKAYKITGTWQTEFSAIILAKDNE